MLYSFLTLFLRFFAYFLFFAVLTRASYRGLRYLTPHAFSLQNAPTSKVQLSPFMTLQNKKQVHEGRANKFYPHEGCADNTPYWHDHPHVSGIIDMMGI